MSHKNDIMKLIANHKHRLQKLKEQQASFGPLYTPAHILTEIEDTKAEIQKLQQELEVLDGSCIDEESPRIQIYLQGNFSSLPTGIWSTAINAFAAIIRISPQAIKVYRVYADSNKYNL